MFHQEKRIRMLSLLLYQARLRSGRLRTEWNRPCHGASLEKCPSASCFSQFADIFRDDESQHGTAIIAIRTQRVAFDRRAAFECSGG
jgi:hypothetical protein